MNKFIKAIYPNLCIFCGERLEGDFCAPCAKKHKTNADSEGFSVAALRYEEEVKNAVWRFKFRSDFFAVRQLSEYMKIAVLEKFSDVEFDFATYVPQTKKKERRRGYNHGKLLAEAVAKKLGINCETALLKVRETKDQHQLDFKARTSNLSGAFKNVCETKGKKILLVDDVITSGNTILECKKVLCEEGECEVYVVVAAKVM